MIDVIITAYNAHETIRKSLMSIQIQYIKDKIKVYIIDDASDKPYNYLLDEFKDLDITLYRLEKNSGPGVARNKGLELSNSEYIMFLDADDMFINEYSIRTLYELMKDNDLVVGVVEEELEDGSIFYIDNPDRCLHAKMYRRSIIDKYDIRFPEIYRHEDCAFHELYFFTNPRTYYINEYVYLYRFNKKSLTHKKNGYDEFLNYKSLIEGTIYSFEKAEKYNLNKHIMEDTLATTLLFLFYEYQLYYNQPYSYELFEWIKPLVEIYKRFYEYLNEEYLLYYYIDFGNNYRIIPYISWDEFIDKASK